jgi:hypothetical protein
MLAGWVGCQCERATFPVCILRNEGASLHGSEFGIGANVEAVLGPAVSDELWRIAVQAASDAGWGHIPVDAFASESNARTAHFWSQLHEPGSNAISSLSVLDWAASVCPACGAEHWEVLYAFPPAALVRATVLKTCVDRELCVLIVPAILGHFLAPHCNKLAASALSGPVALGSVRRWLRPGPLP